MRGRLSLIWAYVLGEVISVICTDNVCLDMDAKEMNSLSCMCEAMETTQPLGDGS